RSILGQHSIQEPKVTTRGANDCRNRLRIHFWKGYSRRTPAPHQKSVCFLSAQRPKLMDKANPRIKLRITCQTFLDTRHADKDKSNPSGIEDGAELFQAGDPKSVRFINDDQLCRIAD